MSERPAAGRAADQNLPGAPPGGRRLSPAFAAVVVLAATVAAAWWLVPWQPLGPGAPAVEPTTQPFATEQVTASRRLAQDLGVVGVVTLLARPVLLMAVALLVARRCVPTSDVRSGSGRGGGERRRPRPAWYAGATALVLALATSEAMAILARVRAQRILLRHGIATQSWGSWWRDEALAFLVGALVWLLAAGAALVLVRKAPRTWPWWGAAAAAGLVLASSFAAPAVVEPLFERTHVLPAGSLRDRIEVMAEREGLGRPEVLVADASSRTTAFNAHVSGWGASRRIVLDDNLVAYAGTDEDGVLTVVAHELGHARRQDVLLGSGLAAGTVAGLVLILGAAARTRHGMALAARARRRARTRRGRFALAVALVAAVQAVEVVSSPVVNLVSRRIEARADVDALETTRDPASFERMWVHMAGTNRSRLDPEPWWRTAWYGTHPSTPWRVGQARQWARLDAQEPARAAQSPSGARSGPP